LVGIVAESVVTTLVLLVAFKYGKTLSGYGGMISLAVSPFR
jgi:hypothetical protein